MKIVYLISVDNPNSSVVRYKIGYTSDIQKRLKAFADNGLFDLRLVSSMETRQGCRNSLYYAESCFHKEVKASAKYKDEVNRFNRKGNSEWFSVSRDSREYDLIERMGLAVFTTAIRKKINVYLGDVVKTVRFNSKAEYDEFFNA